MGKFVALIIGIDGWEEYTLPLIESLRTYQPDCRIVVIDNGSNTPYPSMDCVHRTDRLCYSAAINTAKKIAGNSDWYVVLSNDVLCIGPFADHFADLFDVVAGPCLKEVQGVPYIEGWCVFIHQVAWDILGGWDENYQVSSWEDVDLTTSAIKSGIDVAHMSALPFVHLDQRQRFTLIENYWESEDHNIRYFISKHQVTA